MVVESLSGLRAPCASGIVLPGVLGRQHEGSEAGDELYESQVAQVSEDMASGVVPNGIVTHDRHDARDLVPRRPLAAMDALLKRLCDLLPLRSTRLEIDHVSDRIGCWHAWAISDLPRRAQARMDTHGHGHEISALTAL